MLFKAVHDYVENICDDAADDKRFQCVERDHENLCDHIEILNRDAYRYSKSGDEDTSFDFFFIHSVNLSLI